MNQALHATLAGLLEKPAVTFQNFSVTALFGEALAEPDYLTLDEALAEGVARVTEVSQSGSVPELRFENSASRPVLLLDGEELVGAKQNRVLNVSILVPAKTTITVPVSCVEAGRWDYRSAEFASEDRAFFAEGRMQKMMQVTASLKQGGTRRSDQGAVWDAIADKADRLRVRSDTGAMADLYRGHAGRIDDYVQAVNASPGQLGAVFAINGQVRGIELFDASRTFARLLPKIVRSYAIDAIDEAARENGAPATAANDDAVARFLAEVKAAQVEEFPAVGEGHDLRLTGERVAGGALAARNRIVHLCAFRVRGPHSVYEGGSSMARLAVRARRFRG